MAFIMNMKELLKHISSTSSCMALVATLLAGCAADNTEIQTNGAEQKLDIMPTSLPEQTKMRCTRRLCRL